MVDSNPSAVPRTPEEPTPEQVLAEMNEGEPYTAGDLTKLFDGVSRWTIQRRLESLHEEGTIRRKKHSDNRVTWWIDTVQR